VILREAFFLLWIIVGGTAGELCVSRAMKSIGEVHDFRPTALIRFIGRALTVKWMWIGVTLMALAFFGFLGALSLDNVSFVVPVTALSYAVSALGSGIFLGERVSRQRWAGVFLVCVGVALVFIGKG
jgi:drug/metabolite transporter (DMT)-like permease